MLLAKLQVVKMILPSQGQESSSLINSEFRLASLDLPQSHSRSEQKIDRMETRLENIEKLLQSLVSKSSKMPVEIEQSPTAFTPAAPVSTVAAPTPQVEQFEGESSLVAHSRQAHEALQRLLESAPMTIRNDTNTVNALASLKNVLEKHRSQAPSLNLLSQDGSLKDLTYTDLPPREEVLKLLACVAGILTKVPKGRHGADIVHSGWRQRDIHLVAL